MLSSFCIPIKEVLRSIKKTASNYFSHDVYTFLFNKVFFYRINAVRHFTSYIIKCEDALYCLAFVQPCNCCANSCENVSNISSTLHQFKSAQETIFKVWEKFWGSFLHFLCNIIYFSFANTLFNKLRIYFKVVSIQLYIGF